MPISEKDQVDFLIVAAAKQLLEMVRSGVDITYQTATEFAESIVNERFLARKPKSKRRNNNEKLYEKYEQEAFAKSLSSKKTVKADDLIKERIADLKSSIGRVRWKGTDVTQLVKECDKLELLLEDKSIKLPGFEQITEDEVLRNDFRAERVDKLFLKPHLGKYNLYQNNYDKSLFRVSCLHPSRESILGADILYEYYDEEMSMVRFIALQYKLLNENGNFYFSQSINLAAQLTKLEKHLCKGDFCSGDSSGDDNTKCNFRLPHCSSFLRLTDRLQTPKKPVSSGFHIHICKLDTLTTLSDTGHRIIDRGTLASSCIRTKTFEELFNVKMIGSKWFRVNELEALYSKAGLLEPIDRIVLYAQKVGTLNS
jgi:hypothetical protein